MSRFELGGWVGLVGGVLPGEALPDAHSGNTAALVLELETGDFHPEEYMSFGYTHFEAWCFGASGGYGGNETSVVLFDQSVVRPRMSTADWGRYLELMVIYAGELTPPYGPYGGTQAGVRAYYEGQFPNHDPFNVTTFSNPHLDDAVSAYGGGGGGGGLHIVAGLLVDLPQPTPVVVGQVGANGANGQGQVPPSEIWTPIPQIMTEKWPTTETRRKVLDNYFNDYSYKYPLPHPSFTEGPLPGDDGGTSNFGDVCRASGGTGGGQSIDWPSSDDKIPYGPGGDGGLGDQVVAGGGGVGDPANGGHDGSDGVLDSVLLIGGGGGGGRGQTPGSYQWVMTDHGPSLQLIGHRYPTNGGKGSYSYADTSVYGPRGISNGDLGGGGGGAHRSSLKFGSYSPGYSPNGAVILRIFKA